MTILRRVLVLILLLFLALFALSNRQDVTLGLWPSGLSWQMPLSLAILAGMALAFLAGALLVWLGALRDRRAARRADQKLAMLEAELAAFRAPAARPGRLPAPPF